MHSFLDIKTFAIDVKAIIKEKHLTQQSIGESIGYTRKAINHYLNNPEKISVYLLNVFCKSLAIDLSKYIVNI